ncbi:NAD-dependent deacylase [Candidatus Aminicenantes bacterium AC-708-M15]|jgi:NAD-dependent deacetylase|nr:NAD-dependent deacylase [SCandidatus Aminicenantes bacterium Aminicenantia_JdfR_composite]MCP2603968.1 NAD-dependent deacylase [Candidatus Aminicenantes bacterium AC-708-M15]
MLEEIIRNLKNSKKIVVLTGSGVSAESGIPTFRGKDGLWKRFRAEELATPHAFSRDPKLVWEWYNWRREIIASKEPNPAHKVLASWEERFPEFYLITQNIDGLHQKAGSKKVIELHGNIWEVKCTKEGIISENREVPLKEIPPKCSSCGALLRPNVVWFGESLDQATLNRAIDLSTNCDIMFVIGTSVIVQPAASLPYFALKEGASVVEINIEETLLTPHVNYFLKGKAGEILPELNKKLIS